MYAQCVVGFMILKLGIRMGVFYQVHHLKRFRMIGFVLYAELGRMILKYKKNSTDTNKAAFKAALLLFINH